MALKVPLNTAAIRLDMCEDTFAAECLDCIAVFHEAVDLMRESRDFRSVCLKHHLRNNAAFKQVDQGASRDGLGLVAALAQDQLYRQILPLRILDGATRVYCRLVVGYMFKHLTQRGIRTIHIVDNTLSDERFAATVEIFNLSGIRVISPRLNGTTWDALSALIPEVLKESGHLLYVEPDAEVNYLEPAKALAKSLDCLATFRNQAPTDPDCELLKFWMEHPK